MKIVDRVILFGISVVSISLMIALMLPMFIFGCLSMAFVWILNIGDVWETV